MTDSWQQRPCHHFFIAGFSSSFKILDPTLQDYLLIRNMLQRIPYLELQQVIQKLLRRPVEYEYSVAVHMTDHMTSHTIKLAGPALLYTHRIS